MSADAIPSIPRPRSSDPETQRFYDAVAQAVRALAKNTGGIERIIERQRSSGPTGFVPYRPGAVDTSGWGNIPYLTEMPKPDPPELISFIGAVSLRWNMPSARGIAYTQIFRRVISPPEAVTNDGAIIALSYSGAHADIPVGANIEYAYKIRYVSELGAQGPWSEESTILTPESPAVLVEAIQEALLNSEMANYLRDVVDVGATIENYVTDVLARYTYRSLIDGKKAGFGLSNDGTVTEFAVYADKFFIMQDVPGTVGEVVVPFSVVDGKTYINTALIADASISVAKIAELNATVANLVNLYVQNAVVGGDIMSADFESGIRGWKLHQNGNAELNSAVFRGTLDVKSASSGERVEITNLGIKVYDAQGNMRVNIGVLTS
jgi:hypothetical protein